MKISRCFCCAKKMFVTTEYLSHNVNVTTINTFSYLKGYFLCSIKQRKMTLWNNNSNTKDITRTTFRENITVFTLFIEILDTATEDVLYDFKINLNTLLYKMNLFAFIYHKQVVLLLLLLFNSIVTYCFSII